MEQLVTNRRGIKQVVVGQETSDGAGVRLTRVIGGPQLPQFDPFLLLDHFVSDDPDDYIGGFPPHPHRGFETVTYLLAGQVEHRDNAGHTGLLETGGVQWMTAGRGVIHSEMPQQQDGLLSGFQLWVNLPAGEKMIDPRYQEFDRQAIPLEARSDGVEVRVVAGQTSRQTRGPVSELVTPALFYDITLPVGTRFEESLPETYNGFVYLIEGAVSIDGIDLEVNSLAVLDQGDSVEITAQEPSRLLLVAGQPLHEPIARRGPFVMNSEAELQQAFNDYQEGRF
ncbi:MAG: pirin family protein [Candidatus Thiodiazotropha sp. (ex Lucina aurantia)]|nr:pirin family protein [Candidatus Thiodiazotropha sp. (ex Lucina pensylvanica)]MBT3023520.1 pirin family protein [Candidatus Thiodiazotropha taylori]MBV2098565.1 pirin family protein [Candidatus Thiodiazotropha sp. (ex Codakia orbicularis)]MBV2103581.1 pirin family protein [Candidatus Thiodiazotropha sp. (ex Lucina aurantia)]MBV2117895.1 pirin family protein [Candidatus Thiodiazotropha sp. (ex Lucina aurantia)]